MAKTLTSSGWPLNGLIQDHIGTHGNVYFVNDNTSIPTGHVPGTDDPSHGGSQERPWASLNYAFSELQRLSRGNYGDVIVIGEGHTEVVTAAAGLDCDVAGVTVIFAGRGNARGSIAFSTATTADMDIDAADITFINARFIASIDALAGPIDVNSARFKLLGRLGEMCEWADGTTINTTDCVVGDANADDCVIDGFKFIDGDAAGTQKQSFIQFAAATRPTLRNIYCTGDFGTGIIENGTAWVDALLENLVLDNASVTPTVCLLLQATSTGWVRNSSFRVASGTPPVGYTTGSDMQFDNVKSAGADASSASDNAIGTVSDAAATGAVTNTDTLFSYMKQLVTQVGTDADTDPLAEALYGAAAGISTFPTAAAPANAVSVVRVIRDIWDAVRNGTGGAEPGTNKSIVDAIGFDGAAAVTSTAGMLRTSAGTMLVVTKTLTSSAILTTGVDVTGVSSGGLIFIEDFSLRTDATGLAAGTNFTLETDNAAGAAVFASHAVASLGATVLIDKKTATLGKVTALESGKKVVAKCTGTNCTGTGTIAVDLLCVRGADGAALAAA